MDRTKVSPMGPFFQNMDFMYTPEEQMIETRIVLQVPSLIHAINVHLARTYQYSLLKINVEIVFSYFVLDYWATHCQTPFHAYTGDLESALWEDFENGDPVLPTDTINMLVDDMSGLIRTYRDYFAQALNTEYARAGITLKDHVNELLYAGVANNVVFFQAFHHKA